jgi:hypothetical protein
MRTTKRWERRVRHDSDPLGIGPQLGFAAATLSAFAAWSGLIVSVPQALLMPVIASLFLLFAVGFGLVAWRRRGEDPTRVTYADVAGALTLIGLFAASTLDPDQVVRVVVGHRADH